MRAENTHTLKLGTRGAVTRTTTAIHASKFSPGKQADRGYSQIGLRKFSAQSAISSSLLISVKITEKGGAATVGPMVKGMLRPVGGLENDPQPRLEPEALVHLGSGSCVYEAGLRLVEATAAPYPGGLAASSRVGCRRQKEGLPEQGSSRYLFFPIPLLALDTGRIA